MKIKVLLVNFISSGKLALFHLHLIVLYMTRKDSKLNEDVITLSHILKLSLVSLTGIDRDNYVWFTGKNQLFFYCL